MLRRLSRPHLFALSALTIALIILTLVGPEEATLGAKMRWVYLHVSFTWAGTSLINTAGLVGVYLIVRPTPTGSPWIAPAQAAGLGLFGLGFVLSLIASWTSWGGVLWMEPRVLSSVAILAGGSAMVIAVHSVSRPRVVGIFALALSLGVSLILASTGRVFHPDDPIDTSESSLIRMTFYGLTIVAIALGVVLTMMIKTASSRSKPESGPEH